VIALGWVSLLTDTASDMVYPLLPAFLMSLGGGAVALGWLEGLAEAIAALLKVHAGRVSDRAASRKPLVALGYGISAIARPFYALAGTALHAVAVRVADRVGKGLRGPPRDALLAEMVTPEDRGRAFGFHRMMDNLGAVLGALVAFALLRLGIGVRDVFVWSVVPGMVAVAVVFVAVREPARARASTDADADAGTDAGTDAVAGTGTGTDAGTETDPGARAGLIRYLCVLAIFALASSGDLFLMRRLTELGLDVSLVPVAWVTLQLGKGLTNLPGGTLSDRWGRRRVLSLAWLVYAASYLALGWVGSWQLAWALLLGYAIHYGLAEGGQRALLAEYAPPSVRGRAYGWQLAIEGGLSLPANLLFGWLWERAGAGAAFSTAAGLALVAAVALTIAVPPPAKVGQ